jgi:general secretion pathway protein I
MRRRGEAGFTLVEALVALIIMTAMATVLYRGISSGLRVSAAADDSQAALLLAQERLAAAGIETPLQPGRMEGLEGEMSWQLALRPYIAADEADRAARLQAFWVTATVNWRDGRAGRSRSLELTTLKFGPAQ